jgi:PDZ domain-containing secreted protein
MKDLLDLLLNKKDGDRMKVEYKRGGSKSTATVTLDQFIDG